MAYVEKVRSGARFYLYRQQSGGCDYTIGCGRDLSPLKAETPDEAVREACEDWDIASEGHEREVEQALIFAAPVYVVPVAAVKLCRRDLEQKRAQEAAEAVERAEFERLRSKFGKK